MPMDLKNHLYQFLKTKNSKNTKRTEVSVNIFKYFKNKSLKITVGSFSQCKQRLEFVFILLYPNYVYSI